MNIRFPSYLSSFPLSLCPPLCHWLPTPGKYLFYLLCLFFFFFFSTGVWILGFILAKQAFYLSHTSIPFYSDCFGDGSYELLSLVGFEPWILPISASQVARITGVSYQCLAH
jgi:hypothetical protein